MSAGEAKALGLTIASPPPFDLTIRLNTSTSIYDFDPSNGIGSSQYDLVGALTHELGHGMGMGSLEETLSTQITPQADNALLPWVADFFRFSSSTLGFPPQRFDTAADNRPKYFSVDGGATSLGNFALGSNPSFGNGQQANHWLNTGGQAKIGIMDGLTGLGQKLDISNLDIRFFDVIGFHPVPEAGTWAAGITLAAAALWKARRARR